MGRKKKAGVRRMFSLHVTATLHTPTAVFKQPFESSGTYNGSLPASAVKIARVGKGATSVRASQPSSFWAEEVDVDDDGVVENNQFLYDAKRGMLYTYREDDFTCPNGNPESGSILMALYAKGNPADKPVGSGWYLVNLNTGQCAAKKAGTFGCKFDANGNATECGAATVNNATGEIDVVVAK
jgi:hypothetical protein